MSRVFISNTKVQEPENANIDFAKDKNIKQLFIHTDESGRQTERKIDISGATTFFIDVHCTFKGTEKMQQQGGVIIYRHLLKHFEGKQDKLKVVFYSPLTQEQLVRLKPENYVLKLLPFVECKYEEGQFEKELSEIIAADKFPQFNNASENLLSGWALANKDNIKKGDNPQKINNNGKKILFIDDQQSEWQATFDEIFEGNSLVILKNIRNQEEYRKKIETNWQGFVGSIKKVVNDNGVALIFSDFYLKENHETSEWKDIPKIKSISGFALFDKLRFDFPATPYIFHTSSNKSSIYKFLDANGVDDWLIKDIRANSQNEDKLLNFSVFKTCIEGFLSVTIYDRMEEIWKEIENIDNIKSGKIWEPNYDNDTIIPILKSSWFALRRLLNREVYFEKRISGLNDEYSDCFTATSVCNNLCKIIEQLQFANTNKQPSSFLHELRHEASHVSSYSNFTTDDAILFFKLLFGFLKDEVKIKNYDNRFHKKKVIVLNRGKQIGQWVSHPFSIFWLYIKFYNSVTNWGDFMVEQVILKNRIGKLFGLCSFDIEFVNLLNTDKKISTLLEPGTDTTQSTRLIENPATNRFSIGN